MFIFLGRCIVSVTVHNLHFKIFSSWTSTGNRKRKTSMKISIDKLVLSKPNSNFEQLRTSNFLVHLYLIAVYSGSGTGFYLSLMSTVATMSLAQSTLGRRGTLHKLLLFYFFCSRHSTFAICYYSLSHIHSSLATFLVCPFVSKKWQRIRSPLADRTMLTCLSSNG